VLAWHIFHQLAALAPALVALGILIRGVRAAELAAAQPSPLPADTRAVAVQLRSARGAAAVLCGVVLALIALSWGYIFGPWRLWMYLVPVFAATLFFAARATARTVLSAYPSARSHVDRSDGREADQPPKTLWSFGRRWWVVAWLVAVTLLVVTVLSTGWLSSPDDNGNHTLLIIGIGSASASQDFLGWYYGLPLLAGVAALAALTLAALGGIARAPLGLAPDTLALDLWQRRVGTRTVLALSAGAVIFTLGQLWDHLGSAALLHGTAPSDVGLIEVGTPFASLATPLWVLGYLAQGLGMALLLLPLFARAPKIASGQPVADGPPLLHS
jgi:hypothetical protein